MIRYFAGILFCLLIPLSISAADEPSLPRYDLNLVLDTQKHQADFRLAITWTNTRQRPTRELIINFYPHYRIPEGDHLLFAKTLELLRLNPSHGIDPNGSAGKLTEAKLISSRGMPRGPAEKLPFSFRTDSPTAVVIELPEMLNLGESVTVEVSGVIRLPNKQGRWGYWEGVSYLTNTLPVVAVYDDLGWHAMPFIPWHQPFWNEAGHYTANIRVPADQKLACSAPIESESPLPGGWKQIVTAPFIGRDFAIVSSHRFQEYTSELTFKSGRKFPLKCLAFPEHEHYAKEILKIAEEAIPVYNRWFGELPISQLTYVESFFGWNGNECSGLIMIDERVFGMPHLARGYVDYLVSHETCHQWWYNVIGTNGYAETFMDEGAATYFTHRLLDQKHGKNNAMLAWPEKMSWMPNIRRENYRNASMYGAIRRDQMPAAAGELPGFNHLVGLFTGAYDRGSKIFGMIEARLGVDAFNEFTLGVTTKYRWKILTAREYQNELELYTGQKWSDFFEQWVYGKGLTDWKLERVEQIPLSGQRQKNFGLNGFIGGENLSGSQMIEVHVRQTGEIAEPTNIGISLKEGDGYPIRIPVTPGMASLDPQGQSIVVQPDGPNGFIVRMQVPSEPYQVAIDPDRVLLDRTPGDNVWKSKPRISVVPLYTTLNETDLTADYDRWNLGVGPWVGGSLYQDPWYTRSTMIGVRAGAYRTQIFSGGIYAAYRTDFQDFIVGRDGLFDHFPFPKTQVGFSAEQRLAGPFGGTEGQQSATRAALFGRYVFQYSSSLYLPPLHYVEGFATYQDNFLPFAREGNAGATRPGALTFGGVHYRLNLNTPYWDPEWGVYLDAVYAAGTADVGYQAGLHQLRGELAVVKKLPIESTIFAGTRLAGRVLAQAATPQQGQFFALGGSTVFRGYDLAQRQGSVLWVANVELRLPLARDVKWDVLDHTAGARNVWLALFYDVGDVYTNGRSINSTSHALGAGLRVDTALFSFIERVTLRFDVAKTVNENTPYQFWFGVQHPF